MPWLPRFTDLWRPDGSQIHCFFRGRRRGETGGIRGPLGLARREDPRVDEIWNWDPGSQEIRSVEALGRLCVTPGREASLSRTGEQLVQLKVTQPHLQVPVKRPLPESLGTLFSLFDPFILPFFSSTLFRTTVVIIGWDLGDP